MAWIEFHDDVWDHYKTMKLCKLTGLEDTDVVGKLASLWHFTLRNAWRDANLEPWGDDAIEAACKWRGDPGVFIKALRESGFLDGSIVHGWLERAGRLVTDRIYNEKRRKTSVKRRKSYVNLRKTLATLPNLTLPNLTSPHLTKRILVKPTAQEVEAYGIEISFKVDGQHFLDHYNRNGWVVGKNRQPMKDWKATVRTWKTNDKNGGSDARKNSAVGHISRDPATAGYAE